MEWRQEQTLVVTTKRTFATIANAKEGICIKKTAMWKNAAIVVDS